MSLVYRIQDADGRGPWKPGFSHKWSDLDNKTDSELARLKPMFFVPPRNAHCGVGCTSLKQLRLWFNETEYFRLLDFGYKCVRLDVQILQATDVQCAFAKSRPLNLGAAEVALYRKKESAQ